MISTGVLREKLSTAGWADSPFELLAELSSVVFRDPDVGRELTIRALDSRELLADQYRPILDEITANTGLHPYIVENLKGLSARTALLHAAHEASGEMEGYVIHSLDSRVKCNTV